MAREYKISKIQKSCRILIESLGGAFSWKWDSRFKTALAQFDIKEKEWVHDVINTQMNYIWEIPNTKTVPETVKEIIRGFGGLETGQKLYTSAPDTDPVLLCAWWPWGNGKKISIRLSFYAETLSDDEKEALAAVITNGFDL